MKKRDVKYMERLMLCAANVLLSDKAVPARDGMPGQGTVRYWIYSYIMG